MHVLVNNCFKLPREILSGQFYVNDMSKVATKLCHDEYYVSD